MDCPVRLISPTMPLGTLAMVATGSATKFWATLRGTVAACFKASVNSFDWDIVWSWARALISAILRVKSKLPLASKTPKSESMV